MAVVHATWIPSTHFKQRWLQQKLPLVYTMANNHEFMPLGLPLKIDYNMQNFDHYYCSKRVGAYYTHELIGLPIFLVVKWGQSSPWRSSNSTCALAVVIYGWQCAEIKLQLLQTIWCSRYVNGESMRPSWFSWLSAAGLVNCYQQPSRRQHGCLVL